MVSFFHELKLDVLSIFFNSNMVTWQISHLYVFFPLNEPWLDNRASNFKMKWFLSFMNWGRISNRVRSVYKSHRNCKVFLAHPSVVAICVADCGLFLILKPINKNFMTPYWYPLGIFLISPHKNNPKDLNNFCCWIHY